MSVEEMVNDPRIKSLLRKWGVRLKDEGALQLVETGIGPVLTPTMVAKMAEELTIAMNEIRKETTV